MWCLFYAIVLLVFVLFTETTAFVGISFINWDRTKQCRPSGYFMPQNENEITFAIKHALSSGENVKVVGGGLSFSGIQLSEGQMIQLDKMRRIINVSSLDDGGALVEVEAGIRLRDLCRELHLRGLAMPNLGATATQSIAGAVSTGTHGTGSSLGAIATQIHSFRIIDGIGGIHEASATENAELYAAARVGLGALGILSSVTLKTVPIWKMKKWSVNYSLEQLLSDLPSLMQQYPRLQWSWVPYTDNATVLLREDVSFDTPIFPAEPDGGCWSETQPTGECIDFSYKTLTDSLPHYLQRSLYTEMEMFIPAEFTKAAVLDFIAFMDSVKLSHDPAVQLSAMVRYVAADDILLSPMNGRNTSVISFIVVGDVNVTGNANEFEMYSRGLEQLCESKYRGRPHWGKVNYATAEYLSSTAFPDTFAQFSDVRLKMDPYNVFMNEYLDERLLLSR
jgi:FAD/FMN-containing dehydrogenase